jgi:hypothetical protein
MPLRSESQFYPPRSYRAPTEIQIDADHYHS